MKCKVVCETTRLWERKARRKRRVYIKMKCVGAGVVEGLCKGELYCILCVQFRVVDGLMESRTRDMCEMWIGGCTN